MNYGIIIFPIVLLFIIIAVIFFAIKPLKSNGNGGTLTSTTKNNSQCDPSGSNCVTSSPSCNASQPCPDNFQCINGECFPTVEKIRCNDNSSCPNNYYCSGTTNECIPFFSTGPNCPNDYYLDNDNYTCVINTCGKNPDFRYNNPDTCSLGSRIDNKQGRCYCLPRDKCKTNADCASHTLFNTCKNGVCASKSETSPSNTLCQCKPFCNSNTDCKNPYNICTQDSYKNAPIQSKYCGIPITKNLDSCQPPDGNWDNTPCCKYPIYTLAKNYEGCNDPNVNNLATCTKTCCTYISNNPQIFWDASQHPALRCECSLWCNNKTNPYFSKYGSYQNYLTRKRN